MVTGGKWLNKVPTRSIFPIFLTCSVISVLVIPKNDQICLCFFQKMSNLGSGKACWIVGIRDMISPVLGMCLFCPHAKGQLQYGKLILSFSAAQGMTNRCWNFKNPSIETLDITGDNIYGHHCTSL